MCALGGPCGELGRIPWSDGMFKVQQLSLSVQRAAQATPRRTASSPAAVTTSVDKASSSINAPHLTLNKLNEIIILKMNNYTMNFVLRKHTDHILNWKESQKRNGSK